MESSQRAVQKRILLFFVFLQSAQEGKLIKSIPFPLLGKVTKTLC